MLWPSSTVEDTYEFSETVDSPSCVYSRQDPTLGQYSVDARIVNQPAVENPVAIQLRFPGSIDEPPAAGTYALPGEADLTATFEAPLGTMVGSSGTVTVTELADFREIEIESTVTGSTESGELLATLYCPL